MRIAIRPTSCFGGGRKWGGLRDQLAHLSMGVGGVGRLWEGRGRNNIALIYSSPDFNTKLAYQSHTRPMGAEVVRIMRGITGELSLFGDVLILGDSTSAHCVGRAKEPRWRDPRDKDKEERGVNFPNPGTGRPPRFS